VRFLYAVTIDERGSTDGIGPPMKRGIGQRTSYARSESKRFFDGAQTGRAADILTPCEPIIRDLSFVAESKHSGKPIQGTSLGHAIIAVPRADILRGSHGMDATI